MLKRMIVDLFFVSLAAIPLASQASTLTLVNKTPGAELVIGVRNPLHVRVSNAPAGCKFTKNSSQELISCPKFKTFQPEEHEVAIVGPNSELCQFVFKDRENGWDVRTSGACRMEQTGLSGVMITQNH